MSERNKWIITDHISPLAKQSLEEMGKYVDYRPDISNTELANIIRDYEGLMISSKTLVTPQLIDKATKLKIVARVGSGMEHIDMDHCRSKGIICLNSPEGNCNAVAEHAFGMLLSLANNIRTSNNELLNGIWDREGNRGFELKGMTIGIIGYGHTGASLARKFLGWDTHVVAHDKYKTGFGEPDSVKEVDYKELLQISDIISFHVPYTDETHHWVNHDFIQSCKQGVIIINTSRGAIVDTSCLEPALNSGQLGGICLDVFEDEPLSAKKNHSESDYLELLSLDRVIATPHIAGWSNESKILLVFRLISKIEQALNKQRIQ